MSKPWLVAGLVLASLAFVYTVADGRATAPFFLAGLAAGLPIVVVAMANAATALLAVWLYEGIYRALQWVWHSALGNDRTVERS